jgi:hypothetical protein
MADLRIPVSAIHGMVNTVGDATHGPFIQLLNPVASGIILTVYELRIGASIVSGTSRIRGQRTAVPSTLGGTQTTGLLTRRNETDLTVIKATLIGCTAVVTALFTEANSFWFDKVNADSANTYEELELLRPLSYPVRVKAGSAIEIANPDASATNALRVYVAFDELTS